MTGSHLRLWLCLVGWLILSNSVLFSIQMFFMWNSSQGLVLVIANPRHMQGGGESFNQLYKRCTSALQRIAKKHQGTCHSTRHIQKVLVTHSNVWVYTGERVIVVSHGGTIRALHKRASPHRRCGKVLNTSVNVFHLYDDEKWCIGSWGDVSHLNQTGFLDSGFGGDRNSG